MSGVPGIRNIIRSEKFGKIFVEIEKIRGKLFLDISSRENPTFPNIHDAKNFVESLPDMSGKSDCLDFLESLKKILERDLKTQKNIRKAYEENRSRLD